MALSLVQNTPAAQYEIIQLSLVKLTLKQPCLKPQMQLSDFSIKQAPLRHQPRTNLYLFFGMGYP